MPSPKRARMFNYTSRPSYRDNSGDQARTRNIEPQQNWLARLFRVKPVTKYVCFSISRRRARQETAVLLKEWSKYGIRDVEVDKERNIVFARLGQPNCKSLPHGDYRDTAETSRTNSIRARPQFKRSRVRRRDYDGGRAWKTRSIMHCPLHARARSCQQLPQGCRYAKFRVPRTKLACRGEAKNQDDDQDVKFLTAYRYRSRRLDNLLFLFFASKYLSTQRQRAWWCA